MIYTLQFSIFIEEKNVLTLLVSYYAPYSITTRIHVYVYNVIFRNKMVL